MPCLTSEKNGNSQMRLRAAPYPTGEPVITLVFGRRYRSLDTGRVEKA